MKFLSWKLAAEHIQQGGILAYPTDTVWGLGCRADDEQLVKRCLGLKGKSRSQTASIISTPQTMGKIVRLDPGANWQAFFPGPYTLIFPLKDSRFLHLAGPGPSLGCRIPDFPKLIDLVERIGHPLVTTSLNFHGSLAAQNLAQARAIAEKMGIPMLEDHTLCTQASTVLKWTQGHWQCLRRGAGPFPLP